MTRLALSSRYTFRFLGVDIDVVLSLRVERVRERGVSVHDVDSLLSTSTSQDVD